MSPFSGFGQGTSSTSAPIEPSTPWVAASDGNLELLQNSLATLQLTPSAADDNGYTLLHAAAAYNQTQILEWLMTHGDSINPNAQDSDGDTALHHVDHIDAARFLIERFKINPNLANAEQKTALQVRMEELQEQMDDEDEDEDFDLKALVTYLQDAGNT